MTSNNGYPIEKPAVCLPHCNQGEPKAHSGVSVVYMNATNIKARLWDSVLGAAESRWSIQHRASWKEREMEIW
jgi:hypothetical protein